MRDTLRLRSHLALLACLPALSSLAPACSEGGSDRARPATRTPPSKADRAEPSRTRTSPSVPVERRDTDDASPLPVDPAQARFMPIPGDPPYIDGYNPEEETCVSGNWCGTVEAAMAIAPNADHIGQELGCPVRIIGAHTPSPIQGRAYAGLSRQNSMQGSLNQHGTELARADGKDDTCCYHWFEYCSGRPLRVDDQLRVAPVRDGQTWADPELADDPVAPPSLRVRETLAAAWLEDARAEHASVAAFARATMELMAHGAPPDLLLGYQQAAAEEIEHARRCFGLASRFAGRLLEPGPLPAAPPRCSELARFAADTFVEGCVGETIAALLAQRALTECRDEAVRETLEIIAEDEASHAALTWRTMHWALQVGGAPVAEALRRARAKLPRPHLERAHAVAHPDWAHYGRLDAEARMQTATDAMRDIVGPMLDALLGDPPARERV